MKFILSVSFGCGYKRFLVIILIIETILLWKLVCKIGMSIGLKKQIQVLFEHPWNVSKTYNLQNIQGVPKKFPFSSCLSFSAWEGCFQGWTKILRTLGPQKIGGCLAKFWVNGLFYSNYLNFLEFLCLCKFQNVKKS